MGQSLQATGTLALPGAAQGAPKSAAYKGSVVLNGQTHRGLGRRHAGRPDRTSPPISRRALLDLDKLGGSAGAAPRTPARGQPAAARPADRHRRRCAASTARFKLAAGTLISPPLRIGNADIAATLKDGVLTISHFKGALYGGSLNLSGVVNASQPALAFDFKGDASGLYLGEMLRSIAGTNQFGGTIKVTIDGRLNASGTHAARAAARRPASSRARWRAARSSSGHIFAGADRALQLLGCGRDRRGGRRDRQHAGQRAGHRRPGRRRSASAIC